MDAVSPSIRSFDDFRIGQRFRGGDRAVTEADLVGFAELGGDRHPLHVDSDFARKRGFDDRVLHGPFGLSAFFGWFYKLNLAREDIVGLLDTNWSYQAPIYVGDRLNFDMTITRCRRTAAGDRGIVGRHVRVINQNGTVVQEGTSAVMLQVEPGRRRIGQELFTRDWAKLLADRLNEHEEFRGSMATWDGAFGLSDGSARVEFRVYRGQVIEAGERTPNGANFTLIASELSWARLISAPAADFMRTAMKGAFSVQGAAYDYLRFTMALNHVVDCARSLAREEPTE